MFFSSSFPANTRRAQRHRFQLFVSANMPIHARYTYTRTHSHTIASIKMRFHGNAKLQQSYHQMSYQWLSRITRTPKISLEDANEWNACMCVCLSAKRPTYESMRLKGEQEERSTKNAKMREMNAKQVVAGHALSFLVPITFVWVDSGLFSYSRFSAK